MSLTTVAFICLLSYVSATSISLNNFLFDGDYEFIDLTHPFNNNSIYWPDNKNFRFTKKTEGFENRSWYAVYEFAAGEHGGTHIDAPYHFSESGRRVGDIPIDNLIVPLIIVDVSSLVDDDPNFVLYNHHLNNYLNDNMGQPCLIVFKFGWSKYYNNINYYLGYNENDNTLNFPGLSGEIAELIVSSYPNVLGIGVDVASFDPGSSTDFPVHKTILGRGLYGLENVKLDRPIPETGCTALVLPMKIAEGTGAPLRFVAICPKETIMHRWF